MLREQREALTMRAPPENANAAPGARSGAAAKSIRSKNEYPKDSLTLGRIQCWSDVDLLADRLNLIADYEQHLLVKIRWAQLKMELGVDVAEFGDLLADAEDFKEVCRVLSAPSRERGAA
jgi:hypothetical protein